MSRQSSFMVESYLRAISHQLDALRQKQERQNQKPRTTSPRTTTTTTTTTTPPTPSPTPITLDEAITRVRLLNTVQSIADVAEIAHSKHPALCTRILASANELQEKYSTILLTQPVKALYEEFEKEMTRLQRNSESVREQLLGQHYRFLQQFDELAVASCLMTDLDTIDTMVLKMSAMRQFLETNAGNVALSREHWEALCSIANKCFQIAVDVSLAMNAVAHGKLRRMSPHSIAELN